jgi:arabinan endo-1,5-alpha-L-arabinosidase
MKKSLLYMICGVGLFAASACGANAADGYYSNPVIGYSLPDPTVIRAEDGFFYVYATEDTHNVPIYRSRNLVDWVYAGTAFNDRTRPMDFVPNGSIWAPDINLVNGRYVLYYSKSEWGKTWECGIGVAVSDRPNGGFHDAHKLFVSSEVNIENCIDPFFIEDEGRNYLFWGSFHDIYGVELSADGLSIREGSVPRRIAGGMIEATMIVRHNGFYYLIGSAGTCCEGARSTYRLVVARSRSLFGPYVDRNGRTALDNHFSPLLGKSARVYGPGHCSEFVTDDAGQTWVMYHGFQADNVDAGRVVFLDRVVWGDDGWPSISGSQPSVQSEAPLFGTSAGIDETGDDSGFLFMPTEHPDMLRVEACHDLPFSWQLVSMSGVTMARGKSSRTAIIGTGMVASGHPYLVRLSYRDGTKVGKLLKP